MKNENDLDELMANIKQLFGDKYSDELLRRMIRLYGQGRFIEGINHAFEIIKENNTQ